MRALRRAFNVQESWRGGARVWQAEDAGRALEAREWRRWPDGGRRHTRATQRRPARKTSRRHRLRVGLGARHPCFKLWIPRGHRRRIAHAGAVRSPCRVVPCRACGGVLGGSQSVSSCQVAAIKRGCCLLPVASSPARQPALNLSRLPHSVSRAPSPLPPLLPLPATRPTAMSAPAPLDHAARDMVGYGPHLPDAQWPGGAKIAISFVLNYEEGGEHTLLNGDDHSEAFLSESGATGAARPGRNVGVESGYEYGAHRGFWRILHLFKERSLTFTSWAIGRAVELNPAVVDAMEDAGCEVGSHSYRWIDYWQTPEKEEREHVDLALSALTKASSRGVVPLGWYTGRQSLQTRRIVYEKYRQLGLLDKYYDSDACKLSPFPECRTMLTFPPPR